MSQFPDSFVLPLADAELLLDAISHATGHARAQPYRSGASWMLLRGRLQAYVDRLRERDQPPSSTSGPHSAILEETEPGVLRLVPGTPPMTIGQLAARFTASGVLSATATHADGTWMVVCALRAHGTKAMFTEHAEDPILVVALIKMVAILEARERRVK